MRYRDGGDGRRIFRSAEQVDFDGEGANVGAGLSTSCFSGSLNRREEEAHDSISALTAEE